MSIFTDDNLEKIFHVHEVTGPRGAYEFWYGEQPKTTEDVETFIALFYTAYNERFGTTF